jgi:hypothetical protein
MIAPTKIESGFNLDKIFQDAERERAERKKAEREHAKQKHANVTRMNLDDLARLEFTENREAQWPDAIAYCVNEHSMLHSAREAAYYRIGMQGTRHENDAYQHTITRTAYIQFYEGDNAFAAFDDIADPEKNIILARADEGFQVHGRGNQWLLPLDDPHIKAILERARKTGRIVRVPHVEYLDSPVPETGKYGTEGLMKAIILDQAEPYAALLGYAPTYSGYVAFGKPRQDLALIQGVAMPHMGKNFFTFSIDRGMNCYGTARGVRIGGAP